MSNLQNDILREELWERATDIVEQMIEDKELNPEIKEETILEIYNQLYLEKEMSIETEMDDNSGDDY